MDIKQFEGYCAFDTTEETRGRTSFCGQHATELSPTDARAFEEDGVFAEDGSPRFCEKHLFYLEGYLAGQYDARGRPEEFDPEPHVRPHLNVRHCVECGIEQVVESTFTAIPEDPTTAYRLVCGHNTIDL